MYADKVKEAFVRQYPSNVLFPSELGICVRKSILMRRSTFRRFYGNEYTDIGVSIHADIQQHLSKSMNCEAEKSVAYTIDGITISGKIDLLCNNDLLELKTTGHTMAYPYLTHIMQVAVYREALKQMSVIVNGVYILYINRATLDVQEFRMNDDQLQFALQKVIDFVTQYSKLKDEKDISSIPMGDKMFCKSCEFRSVCYGDILKFF